jgi:hypothetical protein
MASFLVDLGTGVWRIRRKIERLARMPKEIRDALYSLESMWMSMSEGGVEIVDHIGTIPSKREAKVVEIREIPNLVREQVIDAIKPTILLRGEVVQLGEVIIGKPASASAQAVLPKAPEPEETKVPELTETTETPEEEAPAVEVETLEMSPPLKTWEPAEEEQTFAAQQVAAENFLPTADIGHEEESVPEVDVTAPEEVVTPETDAPAADDILEEANELITRAGENILPEENISESPEVIENIIEPVVAVGEIRVTNPEHEEDLESLVETPTPRKRATRKKTVTDTGVAPDATGEGETEAKPKRTRSVSGTRKPRRTKTTGQSELNIPPDGEEEA